MISRAFITEWRSVAPWPLDAQVEQDLVICRALTDIYSHPGLASALAFRGGTAIHKLHLTPPSRYSEDIDLVQVEPGGIGPILGELRRLLDPWLGEPTWKQGPESVRLVYRFDATGLPDTRMRLKIEINTREHFALHGLHRVPFELRSRWHTASVELTSFRLEELLATKLRALYQRKKGRDLFDLQLALSGPSLDREILVAGFSEYMSREGAAVSRAEFEANLHAKGTSAGFGADVIPMLRHGVTFDPKAAIVLVSDELLALLPGDPWKGDQA